jgi:hypothetical protein
LLKNDPAVQESILIHHALGHDPVDLRQQRFPAARTLSVIQSCETEVDKDMQGAMRRPTATSGSAASSTSRRRPSDCEAA